MNIRNGILLINAVIRPVILKLESRLKSIMSDDGGVIAGVFVFLIIIIIIICLFVCTKNAICRKYRRLQFRRLIDRRDKLREELELIQDTLLEKAFEVGLHDP